jgi:hypothetical protein
MDPSIDAARLAAEAGAWQVATDQFAQHVQALEAVPEPSDEPLCDSLLGFGDAATMGLQRHLARPAYLRAATIALRTSARDRLLHAATGYAYMTKAGDAGDGAEELWHRALLVASDDDLVARATLGCARAVATFLDGYVDRAQTMVGHALGIARESGDERARATALAATCVIGWGSPDADRRLGLARELVGMAPGWIPTTGLEGLELQAVPLLELGRFDDFYAIVDTFDAASREGPPSVVAQAAQWSATRALLEGDPDSAEELARRATELAGRPPNFSMGYAAQTYSARKAAGRDGELAEPLRALVAQHPAEPAWRCCLALTLARNGERDAARAMLERAQFEMWPLPSGWTRPVCLAFLVEACALVGEGTLAGMCERELGAYEGLFIVPSTGTSCEGSVVRYLGLAALAQGDRDRARARLLSALDAERATGSPLLTAASERLLATV